MYGSEQMLAITVLVELRRGRTERRKLVWGFERCLKAGSTLGAGHPNPWGHFDKSFWFRKPSSDSDVRWD